jgi:hypothetical protein
VEPTFVLGSKEPSFSLIEYKKAENRVKTMMDKDPQCAETLLKREEENIKFRYAFYKMLASHVD